MTMLSAPILPFQRTFAIGRTDLLPFELNVGAEPSQASVVVRYAYDSLIQALGDP